jgi:hypothetical protein
MDSGGMEGKEYVTRERRYPREIDVTVRCVCVHCNNGWMSKLEEEVKPTIESLLQNDMVKLNRDTQHLLAKWATKTAIIARYLCSPEYGAPPEYRDWFFKNQTPLPNTIVFLGTYNEKFGASLQTKDVFIHDLDGKALCFPHTQFVVFTVGRILVCVLILYLGNRLMIENKGVFREYLRTIWPYHSDIIWPWNPLDKQGKLDLFDCDWDSGIWLSLRENLSEPAQ